MAILIPGRLLFLATPRTGSHAVHRALLSFPGARKNYEHHASFSDIKDYDGELVFTIIRNPYDILVSWYLKFKDILKINFESFLKEFDHPDFTRNGKLLYHMAPYVTVTRWETLQEDFNKVMLKAGLPSKTLAIVNATKDKLPWITYYSQGELEVANRRFGNELTSSGYSLLTPQELEASKLQLNG